MAWFDNESTKRETEALKRVAVLYRSSKVGVEQTEYAWKVQFRATLLVEGFSLKEIDYALDNLFKS